MSWLGIQGAVGAIIAAEQWEIATVMNSAMYWMTAARILLTSAVLQVHLPLPSLHSSQAGLLLQVHSRMLW